MKILVTGGASYIALILVNLLIGKIKKFDKKNIKYKKKFKKILLICK